LDEHELSQITVGNYDFGDVRMELQFGNAADPSLCRVGKIPEKLKFVGLQDDIPALPVADEGDPE